MANHLLIIGGGLIGLELAASARQLGVAVTVLEAAPRVLGRAVPERLADSLSERHQQEGVDIRCATALQQVNARENGQGFQAQLANGETLDADLMIIGIGAIPNQALADAANLETANGIVVNEYLQTSEPDIFAAGDCCCFPCVYAKAPLRLETWRNAQSQGNLAAQNMLGQQQTYTDVPWFWSDQYDLGLQVAGLTNPAHDTVQRTLKNGAIVQFERDHTGKLVAAAGLGEGNSVAKEIRLAEMLIAKGATPAPDLLVDASVNLKKLLR